MRPKLPLARRIANSTGLDEAVIQWTFDNPDQLSFADPCWRWYGHTTGLTPVMRDGRAVRPVRRVIRAAMLGRDVPPSERLEQGCRGMFCVNPAHTLVKHVAVGPWGSSEPRPPSASDADADASTLEDAVYAVYQSPEPYQAPAIAEKYDLPLDLVERAIVEIQEGRA